MFPHHFRPIRLVVPALLGLSLLGCASLPPPAGTAASDTVKTAPQGSDLVILDAPPPSASATITYHLMAAEMAEQRGQNATAAREFLALAQLTGDSSAADRATRSALQAEDPPLARQAAQVWLQLDPQSLDAREVLFRLALIVGDAGQALEQARAMVDGQAGGHDDALRQVAQLLAQSPAPADLALPLVRDLAAGYPGVAGARYAEALLAYRHRDLPAAEAAARAALALDSRDEDSALLLVGLLIERDAFDEATQVIDTLVRQPDSDEADLRLSHARLLLDSGERERARTQLQRIVAVHPDHASARYALGVLALNDGELGEARSAFERVAKDRERGADARYQLAAMAERAGRYQDAVDLYETVDSGNQTVDAAIGRARALSRLGRLDEARGSLSRIRQLYPPLAARMWTVEAQLLIDAGRRDEAMALFAEGLAQRPDDEELLYARSLAYEQLGDLPAAEADLRTMLAADPDDTQALNALGYLLTVHTVRYPEARELIARALANEPEDPAIVDSLGWVEYKLGNLDRARELLQRAHESARDAEIAAHFGEVLWAMGDQIGARRVWNDAQQLHPNHPVLTETMRRLDP